jgi:hypothetical protein
MNKYTKYLVINISLLLIVSRLCAIVPNDTNIIGLSFGKSESVVRINNTVLDSAGNVYLAGYFTGSHMVLDGVTINKIRLRDLCVAKLNPDRSLLWLQNFEGSKTAKVVPNGLVLDEAGDHCVGGFFSGSSLSTPELSKISTSASNYDSFVLKLDTNGLIVWAKNFGSKKSNSFSYAMTVDKLDYIHIGSAFMNTMMTNPKLKHKGIGHRHNDAYVLKLDSLGTLIWANNYGDINAQAEFDCITIYNASNVYLGGIFKFTNLRLRKTIKLGSQDMFAQKLDVTGAISCAKNFDGIDTDKLCEAIVSDELGNVRLGGVFRSGNMSAPAQAKVRRADGC